MNQERKYTRKVATNYANKYGRKVARNQARKNVRNVVKARKESVQEKQPENRPVCMQRTSN